MYCIRVLSLLRRTTGAQMTTAVTALRTAFRRPYCIPDPVVEKRQGVRLGLSRPASQAPDGRAIHLDSPVRW